MTTRGIEDSLLEPFPTVIEIKGDIDSEYRATMRSFLTREIPQPSYMSRAIVTYANHEFVSLIITCPFGFAASLRAGAGGWGSLRWHFQVLSPCCLAYIRGTSCSTCNQTASYYDLNETAFDPTLEEVENDEGEIEDQSRYGSLEDLLLRAIENTEVDPLSGIIIGNEITSFIWRFAKNFSEE